MRFATILSLLLLSTLLNGQFTEPKFGKIEISDLTMSSYEKDTSAAALILFNNGRSSFKLNSENEFQFVYEKHSLIKIFKKSAFSLADISIRLYRSGSGREELEALNAYTYNLDNGKIIKTKVSKDKIYKSEANNYIDVTFAFPEVREGSVIELEYSIKSDFLYNFRGWTFQYNYPALWSQYTYEIPEYFNYRESTKGYFVFDVNKRTEGSTIFTLSSTSSGTDFKGRAGAVTTQNIKARTAKTVLGLKDVPAFVREPNIDCADNYIQSVEFELSSVMYPQQPLQDYTQTWESVNEQMIKDEDFGALLKSNPFLRDTVTAICINKSNEADKAISIYNWVQNRMKWNEVYSLWATRGLKKPFADRLGNSAEINLLLTAMLQSAGIKASPVIFSTRDNGIAITHYPTITKFNSVLVKADIGGVTHLLDAVDKFCPFGVIPPADINGKGRVVNSNGGDWVDLNAAGNWDEVKVYRLGISPEGSMKGSITGSYSGYAGVYYRDALQSEKSDNDYFRKLEENQKGLTISSYALSEKNNNYKPLEDSLSVEVNEHLDIIGDRILFYPLLFERLEKNRYTLEDRKYPVNFNFPITESYSFIYNLPADYKVESLPQSATVSLPDKSISVTYSIRADGNSIRLDYKRTVSKILFLPAEYKRLKDLYDQIVKKHAEQVIIKKSI